MEAERLHKRNNPWTARFPMGNGGDRFLKVELVILTSALVFALGLAPPLDTILLFINLSAQVPLRAERP